MPSLYELLRHSREKPEGEHGQAEADEADALIETVSHPRILVLGTEVPSQKVTSHTWDTIPSTLNMTDYDVVILNYAELKDEELRARINPNDLPDSSQMIRHLFHEASFTVVIGPPIRIGSFDPYEPHRTPQWFLPFNMDFVYESGFEIANIAPALEPYFAEVHRWDWYVTGRYGDIDQKLPTVNRAIATKATGVAPTITDVATNAKDETIAFLLTIDLVEHPEWSQDAPVTIAKSGHLSWLPEATEVSQQDAIELLLSCMFGVAATAPSEPPWVSDYKLPDEQQIDGWIETIKDEIRTKTQQLEDAKRERARIRGFHTILYDKGESLEAPVRDALRVLGAGVQDPEARGGNDGTLSYNEKDAVLEIKGRRAQVKRYDVRQIHDWVTNAEEDPNWEGKGILIGNAHCETPIAERTEDPFDANAVGVAERWDIALITTSQVFRALQQQQAGDFDQDRFWSTIFEASGTVDLPDLEQGATGA